MKKTLLLFSLLSVLFTADILACTSAIFSGKATPDGRPMMWKHRDNPADNVCVEYIKGDKYNFIALMNSGRKSKSAWGGTNDAGFSIMNTASYNLNYDIKSENKFPDGENVMYRALSTCATLEDFEKMLENEYKMTGNESNFGVIDANGGAAYYEVGIAGWTKVDVNDPKIAPQGLLVYANHSYTGKLDDGAGYVRYTTADHIIKGHLGRAGEFTPQWILQNLTRSFYHSLLDIDLVKDIDITERGSGWFIAQDFIPRINSTSAIVITGVKKDEDPANSIMWTILGYPPVSVAVPMFMKAGANQPAWMVPDPQTKNAKMCDMALELKKEIFSVKRGNGEYYMNFRKIHNANGTGYMQQLRPLENKIFDKSEKFIDANRDKKFNKAAYDEFYNDLYNEIESVYNSLID
ncbi:MAG: hypothetical protein IJO23_05980 [Bacteroidales bacterium]|nr:hypothetical protein [Bacteroidales bacterium]